MKFLALAFSFFLLPFTAVQADVVEEEPIVEVIEEEEVNGITEEELNQIINDRIAELVDGGVDLVIGTWETFLTILGVSTFGGILALVHFVLRRFGFYNKLLERSEGVINVLTLEVKKEREDIDQLRKTMMALLALLNVDPAVKTNLIEKLSNNSTVEEFKKVVEEVQVQTDDKELEEVSSLLEKASKL